MSGARCRAARTTTTTTPQRRRCAARSRRCAASSPENFSAAMVGVLLCTRYGLWRVGRCTTFILLFFSLFFRCARGGRSHHRAAWLFFLLPPALGDKCTLNHPQPRPSHHPAFRGGRRNMRPHSLAWGLPLGHAAQCSSPGAPHMPFYFILFINNNNRFHSVTMRRHSK